CHSINRHELTSRSQKAWLQTRSGSADTLVNSGRALPVDEVRQSPGILVEIPLQLALFVENQLRRRIKHPRALALILVVQIQNARSEIEGLRLAVGPCLGKPDLAAGEKDNLPARRCRDHLDIGAVIAQRPGNLDVTYRLHLRESVIQSLVLALL